MHAKHIPHWCAPQIGEIARLRPEVLLRPDTKGRTVLHLAAATGRLRTVRYITGPLAEEVGIVPVNAVDQDGNTALHLAASNGNEHIIEALLCIDGIDGDILNDRGQTYLNITSVSNNLFRATRTALRTGVWWVASHLDKVSLCLLFVLGLLRLNYLHMGAQRARPLPPLRYLSVSLLSFVFATRHVQCLRDRRLLDLRAVVPGLAAPPPQAVAFPYILRKCRPSAALHMAPGGTRLHHAGICRR